MASLHARILGWRNRVPTEEVTLKPAAIAAPQVRDSVRGHSDSLAPTTATTPSGGNLPHSGQPVPPTAQHVQQAAQQIQKFLTDSQRSLEFQIDEASGISVVKVRDTSTGDVIRQIPNEETVKLAQILKDTGSLSRGLLDLTV